MMPRLVVAVIAIQLSWDICVWFINFANALGTGIADIMAAPFGGREALEFIPLLNRLSEAWTVALGFATTTSLIGLVVASVSFGIGGSVLLFFLLVLGSVLVSVLIGLGVLMLRNILIIACVIFAPVAIVLWILPGTERYWKFWKSNFIMLLLLFPLIMIIIYAGRIAAYLGGNLGEPGLLDLLFLLVAFFAPYFIIFKAFKWGGGLLAAGGNAVSNVGNKINAPIKGQRLDAWNRSDFMQGRRLRKTELDRRAGLEYAKGLNAGGIRQRINRGMLRGAPGQADRDLVAHVAETAEEKLRDEEIKTEALAIEREVGTRARSDQLQWLEEQATASETGEHKRQAILSRMGQLQGGEELTRVRDKLLTNGSEEEWNRAVNRNYDNFKKTSPHLANGATLEMMGVNEKGERVGAARTFTAQEDAGQFTNQSDQVLAGMSGSGWQAFKRLNPEEARDAYQRIATSGKDYAANLSPDAHKILNFDAGNEPVPAARLDTRYGGGHTPRDDAYAEDAARTEYAQLHATENRTRAQQQRYEQFQNLYPHWNPGSNPPPTGGGSPPPPSGGGSGGGGGGSGSGGGGPSGGDPDSDTSSGGGGSPTPHTPRSPGGAGGGLASPTPTFSSSGSINRPSGQPQVYPAGGSEATGYGNLSTESLSQQIDSKAVGSTIAKELNRKLSPILQNPQQTGNTTIVNQGGTTSGGEVVEKIVHETRSGWSAGPEMPPTPSNEALRAQPGATFEPTVNTPNPTGQSTPTARTSFEGIDTKGTRGEEEPPPVDLDKK